MLSKLFRHEWKSTWKLPVFLIILMMIMTVVGIFSFSSIPEVIERNSQGELGDVTSAMMTFSAIASFLLYLAVIIAANFGTVIYFAIRFYKNLYTDEGYLMHTLPVTPTQLIWSKFFVAAIWQVLVSLAMFASISVLIICIALMNADVSLGELAQSITSFFSEFSEAILSMYHISFSSYLVWLIILSITGILQSVFCIYAAISIGQCAKKHKIAASVGCYVGFCIINNIISQLLLVLFGISSTQIFSLVATSNYTGNMVLDSYLPSAILALVTGAIYYLITELLMRRRLNLE